MKKRTVLTTVTASLAIQLTLGMSSALAQPKLDEVKIALWWLRNGEYAALMVADAKGYFAEEGIKLTLVDGGPGRNPVPIVGAGQADFGLAPSSEIFRARLAPSPVDVVALGALSQELPLVYIKLANPGDPDPTPKDLEGKTVGVQAAGHIFFNALIKKNGVSISKVKIETVLANAEPLMMGKVDYFAGFLTNQTYQIEQEAAKPNALPAVKGKTWKVIPFQKYGIPMPTNVLFATGKTVRERPDLIQKVMRATAKGLKFSLESNDEANKLVDGYPAQLERLDKLTWRMRLQHPAEVNEGTKSHGLLWTDPKVWEGAMAFYRDAGEIPRVLPVAEVMTNKFNPGIKSSTQK